MESESISFRPTEHDLERIAAIRAYLDQASETVDYPLPPATTDDALRWALTHADIELHARR